MVGSRSSRDKGLNRINLFCCDAGIGGEIIFACFRSLISIKFGGAIIVIIPARDANKHGALLGDHFLEEIVPRPLFLIQRESSKLETAELCNHPSNPSRNDAVRCKKNDFFLLTFSFFLKKA